MQTGSPPILAPRRLPLGEIKRGERFVCLDFDGEEFRASFWRLRANSADVVCAPPEPAWDFAVERGWVPASDRRQAWTRVAARGRDLGDVLRHVLEGTRHDWRPIEQYVRLTGWGADLP